MRTKLIFLTLFVTLGLAANSQNYPPYAKIHHQPRYFIGIHGSPTLHIIDWDNKLDGIGMDEQVHTSTVTPLIGYMAGISFQYNFSALLALHSEINYEKIGYSVRQDADYEIWGCFGASPFKTTSWSTSYTLPTTFKFNIINGHKTNLFLNAGTGFQVFNKQSIKSEYFSGLTYPANQYKERATIQALIGLGTDIQLTKYFHLVLEARDYFIRRSVYDTPTRFSFESVPHSFRLLLGLTYCLDNKFNI